MTKFKPSPDQIEVRAYALFLARGGEDGHAEEDWLAAEREMQLEFEQDLARDSGTEQSVAAAPEEAPKARAASASQRPTASSSSTSARDV